MAESEKKSVPNYSYGKILQDSVNGVGMGWIFT